MSARRANKSQVWPSSWLNSRVAKEKRYKQLRNNEFACTDHAIRYIEEQVIRSSQQNQFLTVLGGDDTFYVLWQDLEAHSPFFREMHNKISGEAEQKILVLQKDEVGAFKEFLIWLRAPFTIKIYPQDKTLAKLGAFAHKYKINQLFNQISDQFRKKLQEEFWTPCPRAMKIMYGQMPRERKLRALYTMGFIHYFRKGIRGPQRSEWLDGVFEKHSRIAREFSRRYDDAQDFLKQVSEAGPCQFHNHSEQNLSRLQPRECPYFKAVPKRVLRSKMKEEIGLEEEYTDEEDGIIVEDEGDIWSDDGFPREKDSEEAGLPNQS